MSRERFFHVVFYKTQRLYVHFGKILQAQRLYVHFWKTLRAQRLYVHILCSKRIGRYVIIHDVNSRQDGVEPVGMLRVRPSQEEINNSIRPKISGGCQEKLLLRRKIFLPMDLITKLTQTITLKPCASAAEYTVTSTRKITSAAENIFPISLMTKLTQTITLRSCASAAEYTVTRTRKITSAAENI